MLGTLPLDFCWTLRFRGPSPGATLRRALSIHQTRIVIIQLANEVSTTPTANNDNTPPDSSQLQIWGRSGIRLDRHRRSSGWCVP
jgi:hypothetical protein